MRSTPAPAIPVVLAGLSLGGCAPDPVLPGYSGEPLWAQPDTDAAVDLGHTPAREPLAGGPITFVDQTVERGLASAVGGGNTHGVALGVVDLDGDGAPEILVVNGHGNRSEPPDTIWPTTLWHNDGTGVFTDVTASAGLGGLADLDGYSVAAGDIDRDGDLDLYLAAQPENVLLENQSSPGSLSFVDVTASWGAEATPSNPDQVADGRSKLVAMGDFDADGWLDLVSTTSTQPGPGGTLLRNTGDRAFEDWTTRSGLRIQGDGHPCALMFTDYDNDGRADLWIWNDRGGHTLLHHDGEAWEYLGSNASRTSIRNPMGIDGADIDHDGDLDYYVSNIGTHPLLINGGEGLFDNESEDRGTAGDFGWGLAFEDFDRDGWPDLFVTQEDDRPWLSYRNAGGGVFEPADSWSHPAIASRAQAHNVAAAFGDLDGDGRIDVVGANSDGTRLTVLMNQTSLAGHWLDVVVAAEPDEGSVIAGASGGVGARVAVTTGDGVQFRDLTAGHSRASQSDLSVRFGLGDWTGAEQVVVLWPDGRQIVRTGVPGDQVLRLEAP